MQVALNLFDVDAVSWKAYFTAARPEVLSVCLCGGLGVGVVRKTVFEGRSMALCDLILRMIVSHTTKSCWPPLRAPFCLLDSFDAPREHVLRDVIDQE